MAINVANKGGNNKKKKNLDMDKEINHYYMLISEEQPEQPLIKKKSKGKDTQEIHEKRKIGFW
jgi:hypothetical protein